MFKNLIELDLKSIRPFSGTGWGMVLTHITNVTLYGEANNNSFKNKYNV